MSGPYSPSPNPAIRVRVGTANGQPRDYSFTQTFRIGRVAECELCIEDPHVSRHHATVAFGDSASFRRGAVSDAQLARAIELLKDARNQTELFALALEG